MFEFRGSRRGDVSYWSIPGGRPPRVRMLSRGQAVVFENAETNFPHDHLLDRVRRALHARIEGPQVGKPAAAMTAPQF